MKEIKNKAKIYFFNAKSKLISDLTKTISSNIVIPFAFLPYQTNFYYCRKFT